MRAGAERVAVAAAERQALALAEGDGELVAARVDAGRGAEGAVGQEDGEARLRVLGHVGRGVLVQVAGGGEDVEALRVALGEALLAVEHARVDRDDRRVVLARVVDVLRVAKRRLRVEQVVGPGGEGDPLGVGLDRLHLDAHQLPRLLDLRRHAAMVSACSWSDDSPAGPVVERLPGGLERADDALLEVRRVLLHYTV